MSLKNLFVPIVEFFSCPGKRKELETINYSLGQDIENLKKSLNSEQDRIEQLQKEATEMLEKIDTLESQIIKPDPNEELWNNKHPKQDITYKRKEHDQWYNIDVRNYFQPHDSSIPTVSGSTSDEIALNALKWINKNIKYVHDEPEYGIEEFWAYAYQTLVHKKGDCEDGAILLANIMLKSGIPYWRIRLNAGDVKGGGHAYVTYCRETDNQFVVLDWCYWYSSKEIKDRPLHKDELNYYGIWFSWNLMYAFGKMETMMEMPKKKFKNGEVKK